MDSNKPLIKKAMSEQPRSDGSECFHSKSGSFSHFTNQGVSSSSVQSREELIAKYCPDSRPGSTTPHNDSPPPVYIPRNNDSPPPVYIPHNNDSSESTNSSPLDHFVHTDPHLDGNYDSL